MYGREIPRVGRFVCNPGAELPSTVVSGVRKGEGVLPAMKQPTVTPIRETGAVTVPASGPLPNIERDLRWIDEVAALLPEESRLGWYRNVGPWLRMLPPDDEVAHLAYSMGYLALLTRVTPELIAAERAKLAALSRSLIEEMTAAAKTTAVYHQKLSDRLIRAIINLTDQAVYRKIST